MALFHRVRGLVKSILRRDSLDAELDAEVRDFYQAMVNRYVEQGLPEPEAHRLARIKFGNPERVKQEVRAVRSGAMLESFVRDVHYAFRRITLA